MDFSSATSDVNVQFQYMMSYHWGVVPNNNDDINLLVTTDGGITWAEIWDETMDPAFTSTAENYKWRTISVPLATYVGQADVRLAFQYYGIDGAQGGVDGIVVTNTPYALPNIPDNATTASPADAAIDIDIDIDETDGSDADTDPDMTVTVSWTAATTGDPAASFDVFIW